MTKLIQKWLIVIGLLAGVPGLLIWLAMPYLDCSMSSFLLYQRRYDEALRPLNRALSMNHNFGRAYVMRGWIYDRLQNREKALADYDRAIVIDPTNAHALNNRGWLYVEMGNYPKAIEDARAATELNPLSAPAHDTLAVALFKAGQHEEALAQLNKALEIDLGYTEAYKHRSELFEAMGKKDLAELDKRKASDLLSDFR